MDAAAQLELYELGLEEEEEDHLRMHLALFGNLYTDPVDPRGTPWGRKVQRRVLSYTYQCNPRCERSPFGRDLTAILADAAFPERAFPYETLRRWVNHVEEFHELPCETAAVLRAYEKLNGARPLARVMPDTVVAFVKALCDDEPDLYLDEFVEALMQEGHGYWTTDQVGAVLKGMDYTRKKLDYRSIRQSELEAAAYKYEISDVDATQFLFIDEKSKNRYSARRRFGRALSGKRAVLLDAQARSARACYSFIGAADVDGLLGDTCVVYWRPRPRGQERAGEELTHCNITSNVFEHHLETFIAPHLGIFELGEPRSVVVMDNASWHKRQRVQEIIESCGARLVYTPVGSPALNPIEFAFSKYAAELRRHQVALHGTPEEICLRVEQTHHDAVAAVTRADMIGIYKHCGFISNVPDR
jgi:hypothetical protein